MTEYPEEIRRQHDPNDPRGGGGPGGPPEDWPTSRQRTGPLRTRYTTPDRQEQAPEEPERRDDE